MFKSFGAIYFHVFTAGSLFAAYSNTTQALTGGGGAQSSLRYTQRATLGETIPNGQAKAGSTSFQLRTGHIGQNAEVVGLLLNFAESPSDQGLRENTSRALRAVASLDDSTFRHPPVTDFRSRVVAGPVSTSGQDWQILAGAVRLDTPAVIEGGYRGFTSLLELTVLNVVARYDDWLSDHFSPEEVTSGLGTQPTDNPSGDGVPNLLKYALDLDPATFVTTPPTLLGIEANRLRLTFRRIARPDLTYQVEAGPSINALSPIWTAQGATGPTGIVGVYDTATLNEFPARFMRLRVTPTTP